MCFHVKVVPEICLHLATLKINNRIGQTRAARMKAMQFGVAQVLFDSKCLQKCKSAAILMILMIRFIC